MAARKTKATPPPARDQAPAAPEFVFPFFGAGDADYFEWAEVHVYFARVPTAAEKKKIRSRVPPPLRDSVDWEGQQLMVASDQFAHAHMAQAYPLDPEAEDAPDEDEDEEDGEESGRFFFAAPSQVRKFNEDIEAWLAHAHAIVPIVAAYRGEDDEAGGTTLSAWHG